MKLPRIRNRADQLEVAIIINQLATPGLGSWMAGHRIMGAGQLALAILGFTLSLVQFGRTMGALWSAVSEGTEAVTPNANLFYQALIPFGIAWLWAGITSVQMAFEIRRLRSQPPALPLPPRLDADPG